MTFERNKDNKITAIQLVRTFFGCGLQEMKDLPAKDRTELASAIARQEGVDVSDLSFEPVAY
jgi:ribosomal protein L7/L12